MSISLSPQDIVEKTIPVMRHEAIENPIKKIIVEKHAADTTFLIHALRKGIRGLEYDDTKRELELYLQVFRGIAGKQLYLLIMSATIELLDKPQERNLDILFKSVDQVFNVVCNEKEIDESIQEFHARTRAIVVILLGHHTDLRKDIEKHLEQEEELNWDLQEQITRTSIDIEKTRDEQYLHFQRVFRQANYAQSLREILMNEISRLFSMVSNNN